MNKKLLALGLAFLTLTAAGCDDACEEGFKLQTDVQGYEVLVGQTLSRPDSLPESCATFNTWQGRLGRGSDFANRVAYDYFYAEDRRCISWHHEQRCYWDRYRGRRVRRCTTYRVCDGYQRIPHRRDGFHEAKELSRLLREVRTDLSSACSSYSYDPSQSVQLLSSARVKFSAALYNGEYVLRRAGCYNRSGN